MIELPNQNNQVLLFFDLLFLNPSFLETDLSSGSEHFRTFFGSSKYNFTIPKNDDFEGSTMGSSQIVSIHGELGSRDGSNHSCSGSIQSTNDSTLASSTNPIIGWMIGSSTELNGTREILVPESSSSSHLSCNKRQVADIISRDSCEHHVIDTNNNYIDCETRSETTECLQAQLQYRLSNSNIRKYNYGLRDVQSEPTGSGDESISGLEGNHLARAVEEAFQDQHFQRRFAQKYYSQCLKNGLPILH